MPDEARRDLEELAFFSSRVMVNILAQSLEHEEVYGLSVQQYRVLDTMYHGTDDPSDLTKMLALSPRATRRIIRKLDNKSLLSRTHTQSVPRRTVIGLTDAGEDVVRKATMYRRKVLSAVLDGMTAGDLSQLENGLEAFNDSYVSLIEEKRNMQWTRR